MKTKIQTGALTVVEINIIIVVIIEPQFIAATKKTKPLQPPISDSGASAQECRQITLSVKKQLGYLLIIMVSAFPVLPWLEEKKRLKEVNGGYSGKTIIANSRI